MKFTIWQDKATTDTLLKMNFIPLKIILTLYKECLELKILILKIEIFLMK